MDASSATATMPHSGVVAAVLVLVYSFFCLSCGALLVMALYHSSEKLSYVVLFAISTTCSTAFNIIQQINYIANWHRLRVERYEASLEAYNNPSLALGPQSKGFNEVLFWIVLYFYNVDSAIMLFWAIALVFHVWNWRHEWLVRHEHWLAIASKMMAFLLPALVVGLRKAYQVHLAFGSAVVLLNILMLCSFFVGSVCIALIVTKYLQGRLALKRKNHATDMTPIQPRNATSIASSWTGLKMRLDPWLLLRFIIAFLILSALEVFLIVFEVKRYKNIKHEAKVKAPDFGSGATIQDILNYIPGVTASLFAFLLFGTNGPLRNSLRKICHSLLASFHPFRRRAHAGSSDQSQQPQSSGPSTSSTNSGSRTTSTITKGTSIHISVTNVNQSELAVMNGNFDPNHNDWFPGKRQEVLQEP